MVPGWGVWTVLGGFPIWVKKLTEVITGQKFNDYTLAKQAAGQTIRMQTPAALGSPHHLV